MKIGNPFRGRQQQPAQPAAPPRRVLVGVPKLTDDQARELAARLADGETEEALAVEFDVDPRTVRAAAERARRAQQPTAGAPAAPADQELLTLRKQLEAEKLRLQLEALRDDPEFRQRALFGDARPKTLDAETIRRVHEYDEQDGWLRVPKTRLEDLLETEKDYNKLAEQLHKFQLEQARSGQGGKLQEVRGIVEMVKPLVEPYLHGAGSRFVANVPASAVVSGLAQPPQLPPGSAQNQSQPPQNQEVNAEMDFLTMAAKANLDGKPAPERAAWLASLPMLSEFIPELCGTPDGGLLKRIESTAAGVPMYRGVMTWIAAQGEAWVVETVRELRKLTTADAAAAAAAGADNSQEPATPGAA